MVVGLGQWIIIIVLVAIILFGFAAVFDFSKGVIRNVYPLTAATAATDIIISKVDRVIDGDTLLLETGDRIRLAIVNTPEKSEDGWLAATLFTTDLCLGKTAIVDLDDNQPKTYNRLVGLVYCDYSYLNLALLMNGHAQAMEKFCKYSEFKDDIICQYEIE